MKKGTKRDRRRQYAIRRNLRKVSCVVLLVLLFLAFIGIRRQEMERTVLTRKTVDVKTRFGVIPVKISGEGDYKRVHPEYEKVSGAASEHGVPFGAVYDEVLTMTYRNEDIS